MERIQSLGPISNNKARVLILGSMPGNESLSKQQYYANPRNHFWRILFAVFHTKEIDDYKEKIAFLKENKIAIWDVIHTCYREGSLDSNIKEESANDIRSFLMKLPDIKLIACNGTKAFNTFNKFIDTKEFSGIKVIKLPSSSPVPGRYNKTLHEKIELWSIIKDFIDD